MVVASDKSGIEPEPFTIPGEIFEAEARLSPQALLCTCCALPEPESSPNGYEPTSRVLNESPHAPAGLQPLP
jgi:hypothetical protein